jgi:hypothetical protein
MNKKERDCTSQEVHSFAGTLPLTYKIENDKRITEDMNKMRKLMGYLFWMRKKSLSRGIEPRSPA